MELRSDPRNDSRRTTRTTLVRTTVGNGPSDLWAADLDADGDADLAVGEDLAGGYRLLVNDGAGLFTSALARTPCAVKTVGAADFSNDGAADLVLVCANARIFRANP